MLKTERVGIPVMPAIPWDTTEYCCKLEGGFISSLLGLGEILKLYRVWDGTDEEIQAQMAQVEKGLQALMGASCCDDAIVSLRTGRGGYLIATNGAGDTFIVENSTSASDILAMPEEQETDNSNDNVCAGVKFMSERYWADIDFALDQAQLVTDQVKLASEGLSAILTSIPLFGASAGILFDGWEEFIGQVVTLGISTLKLAFSDPAVRLAFQENLYCAIIDNANILTEEMFFGVTDDLPLLETQSTILADFVSGFELLPTGDIFQNALRWYNLGALNSDNTCAAEFGCIPGWILEADLTLSDGGLAADFGGLLGGTYVPGVGWQATTQIEGVGYHRNVAIRMTVDESTFKGAGMDFTYTQGVMDGSTISWYLAAGGFDYGEISSGSTPPESPWDVTGAEHVGTTIGYVIPVGVDNAEPGGQATITKVRIYGVGTPPEITGWELVG